MSCNPSKRRRVDSGSDGSRSITIVDPGNDQSQPVEHKDLYSLINSREWGKAAALAKQNPRLVSDCIKQPSMLALCCRSGAPFHFVKEILDAAPSKLRHLVDSRGTPLHEAVVCDEIGPMVIGYLLKVDEELDSKTDDKCNSVRAAMLQDVDGYTPLHLLIRRRFQSHVLADTNDNEKSPFIEILNLLVESCAEAIVISDRGEYEEPPIVMAIKANVYAPMLSSEEITTVRMERHIYNMVRCMLQHYPKAASTVFNGYRGHYTTLHSAVFHGRCPDTIELLLNAEKESPSNVNQKACLLGNTQGELPLHFCAMRGEPPRTVALLAKAAPEAISQRDASGLTPIHWLWIRFVSTLLAVEDGRGNSITVPLRIRTSSQIGDKKNAGESLEFSFSSLEQDNFEADFMLLRKIDPTVDFLRMRHIPTEVQEASEALQWAEHSAAVLKGVRRRLESLVNQQEDAERVKGDASNRDEVVVLTRLEAITTLFWIKVVSLLKAVATGDNDRHEENGDLSVVRTAFESGCCPPLVARIVALLLPNEFSQPDSSGRVALHYAAMRPWHAWEWPREDGTSESASSKLLNLESASLLRNAMSLSSVEAARHRDNVGRLPIHYMISTCIQACCASGRSCSEDPVIEMLEILGFFVKLNPVSLNVCDPVSGLLPFLQASAESTKAINSNANASSIRDEFALSIVFLLLRQDPSLVRTELS
mmetsp:Transcript_14792/g.34228  ORF Transcript_14792/g.34228 Transcript_14792/m.34228 type:complete len:706 (+) Transcript_14792:72-2189(+)